MLYSQRMSLAMYLVSYSVWKAMSSVSFSFWIQFSKEPVICVIDSRLKSDACVYHPFNVFANQVKAEGVFDIWYNECRFLTACHDD